MPFHRLALTDMITRALFLFRRDYNTDSGKLVLSGLKDKVDRCHCRWYFYSFTHFRRSLSLFQPGISRRNERDGNPEECNYLWCCIVLHGEVLPRRHFISTHGSHEARARRTECSHLQQYH
jgi:hypothetical protein